MAFLLGFRIEHGPVIAAVVFDLQGVGADQNLGGTNEGVERTLIKGASVSTKILSKGICFTAYQSAPARSFC